MRATTISLFIFWVASLIPACGDSQAAKTKKDLKAYETFLMQDKTQQSHSIFDKITDMNNKDDAKQLKKYKAYLKHLRDFKPKTQVVKDLHAEFIDIERQRFKALKVMSNSKKQMSVAKAKKSFELTQKWRARIDDWVKKRKTAAAQYKE